MPLKIVLVTSAMPAEGKTFICANLAHAFVRQHERRILLVDADLRWSRLHSLLGAPPEPGLSDYLRGEAGLEEILQRGPQDNLYLIPGGKAVQNPAELLAGGKLKELLDQMAPLFDWVLLDAPPAGPLSDPSIIADWCDGTLLVVQSGTTPYDVAQRVTEELREKRLLGVVLNRAEPAEAGGGYYGDYSGYGGYPSHAAAPPAEAAKDRTLKVE
jgi:capsular exopolysaccharide synthesis family protein